MRTHSVTVRPEDLPKLEAVAHTLWEMGCLGVSLATDDSTLTFDDDVYDVLADLSVGVDGHVCKDGLSIGDRLYSVRQVA